MSQNTNNSDNQEIDLSMISDKIKGFFDGIAFSIFKGILFLKRNLLILVILLIAGIGFGIFLDTTNNSYDSEIIVKPNFGSTDYLYSKIDLLESKIKNRDTVFLKSIGIESPKNIIRIEIAPIIDIYRFVNYNEKNINLTTNTQNFELVKLLAENGDINKVIKDKTTSKNYYWHTIHLVSKGFISEEKTIKPLLAFLNNNNYYQSINKLTLENIRMNIKKDEEIILQINVLLENLSNKSGQNAEKLVFYNENTDLNEVLKTKQALVYEIGAQKEQLVNLDSPIKKNSSILNIKNMDSVNGKLKFLFPLFLIFGFIFINLFLKFYKKQSLKALHNKVN
jgi:hypothetical protein